MVGYRGRYSGAKGAERKYEIDKAIYLEEGVKGNLLENIGSAKYWKSYIERASKKAIRVQDASPGLQFFMVKDGFEGFLPPKVTRAWNYKDVDPDLQNVEVTHDFDASADDVEFYNPIAGPHGAVESFEANEALVVFDGRGTLDSVFQLLISNIRKKDHLSEGSWNNKRVLLATPRAYSYPGLSIEDFDRYFADIHGYIGSHGCVQICPVQPDGSIDFSPWDEFATKHLPHWDKKPRGVVLGRIMMVGY